MNHRNHYPLGTPSLTFFKKALPLLIVLMLAGIHPAIGQPGFSNQTGAAGLTFLHQGAGDHKAGPMHAGGVVDDFNQDGWNDLFVIGGGATLDRLFINDGGTCSENPAQSCTLDSECGGTCVATGTFTDRAADWGLTEYYRGTGANAADYNNDGWVDIFVTSMGDVGPDPQNPLPQSHGHHRLYRNDGGTGFTNVATDAGVNETTPYPDGFGVAWGDYNQDGKLDLFVGGWFIFTPESEPVDADSRLFRNNGDGTFTDVTDEAGIFQTSTRGFGAIFVDMNADRWPEILVSGDFGTNRYYRNNADGTFTELDPGTGATAPVGDPNWSIGKAHNGMGTTIGDFNRDGRPDWFVTAIWPTWAFESGYWGNGLYINQGNHILNNIADTAGDPIGCGHPVPGTPCVQDGGWGWGTSSLDFDHDGWLDIVMTNGWRDQDPLTGEIFTNEQAYLFQNNGNLTFDEVALGLGLVHTQQGRGLMTFDADRDGDLDIVILSNNQDLQYYRNDLSGPDTNWLQVVLDTSAHPGIAAQGLGASLRAKAGTDIQFFRMNGGSNYLSRSQNMAHFGLAGATSVDELRIVWPDGFRNILTGVAANQILTVAAEKPFSHDPGGDMVRGQPVDLVVRGLLPNDQALFYFGIQGTGAGPCPVNLNGLCFDLLDPRLIGGALANASGEARLTIIGPSNPSLQTIYTQATVRRGVAGLNPGNSLKSNTVASALVD